MATIAFKRGLQTNLPSPGTDGTFYLTTDTLRLYYSDAVAERYIGGGISGATLPASPPTGMHFLWQTTGRSWLMLYDGTVWQPLHAFGTTTIYVDTALGTDSITKGTGTGAAAYATLQYARNQLPNLSAGNIVINAATGTYRETLTIQGIVLQGNFTITLNGVKAADTLGPTTATSGANPAGNGADGYGTITKTGATWTVNAFQNLWLEITAGTGAGQVRLVQSNTATVTTIVGRWDTPPDATSVFHVVGAGTIISGADAGAPTTPVRAYCINLNLQTGVVLNYLALNYAANYGLIVQNYSVCDMAQVSATGCATASYFFTNTSNNNTITNCVSQTTFADFYATVGSTYGTLRGCRASGASTYNFFLADSYCVNIKECYFHATAAGASGILADAGSKFSLDDYTDVDGAAGTNHGVFVVAGSYCINNSAGSGVLIRIRNWGGWGLFCGGGGTGNNVLTTFTYTANVSGTATPVVTLAGGNT